LIYKCGGIDQRTIEKFEKVIHPTPRSITSHADPYHRKPPSSVRVPSSTLGFLTSSRPSVSVVSPSILPSGSSRPPSMRSPSSVRIFPYPSLSLQPTKVGRLDSSQHDANPLSQMPPVTVTSSRT
jgi:hypothetical protein